MASDMQGFAGSAEMVAPEDRICFHLIEFPMLRRLAVVSVDTGEAYRIDHLYDVRGEFQVGRVVRLTIAEAAGLPVP